MVKKIISAIRNGTFFERVLGKIKLFFINRLKNIVTKNIDVNNNRIMFLTFQGDYTCNQKAICNELLSRNKNYELFWAVSKDNLKNKNNFPDGVKLIRKDSFEFYKIAASCKFFIENANNFCYLNINKKEEQILIQTWHGSMGFKKIDNGSVKNSNWVRQAVKMGELTDFCVVNSDFEIDVFRNSYWKKTPMLKYGHARNDCLFNKNNEFKVYSDKVKKMYNIDKDTKILLYAPTFRDNCTLESYKMDYDKLIKALEKRFGGKWCVLLRLHYKLKYANIPKKYFDKVINATSYPDMQELLCAVDIGITDYSSWMCDFVLTKKPGFLFTLDIEKYVDERGFYYPLDSSPFPVCKSNKELVNNILNFDENKYISDVEKFLERMGCFEDGKASGKIVDKIIKLCNKK